MKTMRKALWAMALLCGLPLAGMAHDTLQPIANTEGGSGVVALSSGGWHTCGLRADGSAACWGYNGDGRATPPTPNGPYLSLSSSGWHTCGLRADGSAACWGSNGYGQAPATPPAGPYLSLSSGFYHTCGLRADGSAACWGWDIYGQAPATPPAGPYLSLSSGYYHTCGLRADGGVACWGAGGPGSSGDPNFGQSTVPAELQAAGSTAFGQIAAGNAHACQVRRDGTLGCWGSNGSGQTAAPAGTFTLVGAGDGHGCAIGTNGEVTCWGQGATANNAAFAGKVYRQLALGSGARTCAMRANLMQTECASWGSNPTGDFALEHPGISMTGQKFCLVNTDNDREAQCYNNPSPGGISTDPPVAGPWQRVEAGLNHACGLKLDGSLGCWGDNTQRQTSSVPTGLFRNLSVGYNHACAIKDDGTLACWGDPTNNKTIAPTGTYVQVAAGNTFTCAIRIDGVRLCWGDDNQGQAPQLALSPGSLADGQVGIAHAGATFSLSDAGQNADGDYVPPTPVFYADPVTLPPGLSLSVAGVLSGTPTAGGSFTFTVEGEDANGFVASRDFTITIIADSTPPAISYALDPADPDGDNGWYVSDVSIDWTVNDPESGITSSTGCNDTTLATDTAGASWTCTATSAGGSNSVTTATIKRDATPPILAPTAPSPLLRGGSYVASPNASDATSGIASSSCGAIDTSSLGDKSLACTATDNAGNVGNATLHYTVTTTCSNDGYSGIKLNWCRNICEMGYTGTAQDIWLRRWKDRYHDDGPYCIAEAQPQPQ